MYDFKATNKQMHEMVHKLAIQDLCNEQAMGDIEWFKYREGQDYTRIAYTQSIYGITSELYYMKKDKRFCYV